MNKVLINNEYKIQQMQVEWCLKTHKSFTYIALLVTIKNKSRVIFAKLMSRRISKSTRAFEKQDYLVESKGFDVVDILTRA